jgi:two-component system response regulator FixJ
MQQRRGRVAIIDDDEGVREPLTFFLLAAGYAARSYDSAQSFLASWTDAPDCLIVDQLMPGMTGLELAAQLRREGNAIPVLLISGWICAAFASNAAQISVETLAKPVDETLLLSFVDNSVCETSRDFAD